MTVLINVFGGLGNSSNKYGNRLEGIEQIQITEKKQSDFENNIANLNYIFFTSHSKKTKAKKAAKAEETTEETAE